MTDSYTPPQSTVLMPQFDMPKCSQCRQPKTVVRILQDWGVNHDWNRGRYEVLARCTTDRCSWNDCFMHLTLDEPGFVQRTTRRPKPQPTSVLDMEWSWTPVATSDEPPTTSGGILSLL